MQDAEYEQGLPYLRGMPEAFMPCADVTLVVGQRELPVHSQVLASKSTFFANMWAGALPAVCIHVTDADEHRCAAPAHARTDDTATWDRCLSWMLQL